MDLSIKARAVRLFNVLVIGINKSTIQGGVLIYPCNNYEQIFTESINSQGFQCGVKRYRVKTIRSGSITEVEIFPIWKTRSDCGRAKKKQLTRKAQEELNERNSIKKLSRLLNANFTDKDIWLTLTYDDEHLPDSEEKAYKDTANYIRRLRRVSKEPLKYIIVTETHTEDGEPTRVHHHIVVNFPDRDTAERLWKLGGRKQSRRLQPDIHGFDGMAHYLGKQKKPPKDENRKITRRWRSSRNLKKPKVTVADYKIGRRKAESLAKASEGDRRAYFEKLYPKERYIECQIRYSDFVSGAYIYTRMRRDE